jgi:hypothetical protein
MTDTTGALPPAGWYPDPYGAPFERWWDGQQWTEHTNTPAAPEPVAPAQPEPTPYAEPVPYAQPVQADPYAQPSQPDPYAQPAPAAYVPPALDEPYSAGSADPFAGFVTPSQNPTQPEPAVREPAAFEPAPVEPEPYQPQAYQPQAYEPQAYQPQAYQQPSYPEPAAQQPAAFDPAAYQAPAQEPAPYTPPVTAQPAYQPYTPPAQGYDATPAAPAALTGGGGANPPSAFDFGFGATAAASHDAPYDSTGGDSGLFGSWTPEEYVEPARNGAATAGLTLGILSFFFSVLVGIPGLIASAVGIGKASRLEREGDGPVGRGKAVTGLLLSLLGSGATVAAIVLVGLPFYQSLQQPTDTATNQPDTNTDNLTQNGGIPLEIGTIGMIVLPDSDLPAIQFAVTSITPNFTCTADPATVTPSANGQFVAVTMNFTTDPNYLTSMVDSAPLHMSQADWIGFLADDAGTQVTNSEAGNTCISAAEQFPADIPAGANTSGTIILDMASDVFSISWGPSGVTNLDPGETRWEWMMTPA